VASVAIKKIKEKISEEAKNFDLYILLTAIIFVISIYIKARFQNL